MFVLAPRSVGPCFVTTVLCFHPVYLSVLLRDVSVVVVCAVCPDSELARHLVPLSPIKRTVFPAASSTTHADEVRSRASSQSEAETETKEERGFTSGADSDGGSAASTARTHEDFVESAASTSASESSQPPGGIARHVAGTGGIATTGTTATAPSTASTAAATPSAVGAGEATATPAQPTVVVSPGKTSSDAAGQSTPAVVPSLAIPGANPPTSPPTAGTAGPSSTTSAGAVTKVPSSASMSSASSVTATPADSPPSSSGMTLPLPLAVSTSMGLTINTSTPTTATSMSHKSLDASSDAASDSESTGTPSESLFQHNPTVSGFPPSHPFRGAMWKAASRRALMKRQSIANAWSSVLSAAALHGNANGIGTGVLSLLSPIPGSPAEAAAGGTPRSARLLGDANDEAGDLPLRDLVSGPRFRVDVPPMSHPVWLQLQWERCGVSLCHGSLVCRVGWQYWKTPRALVCVFGGAAGLHDLLVPNLRSLVKKGAVGAACRLGMCSTRKTSVVTALVAVLVFLCLGYSSPCLLPLLFFFLCTVSSNWVSDHTEVNVVLLVVYRLVTATPGGMILDGGTESGVMAMVGSALRFTPPKTVRIVGVCPKELLALPNAPPTPESTPLEPHHSSFMLVPSREVRFRA